MSEKEIQEYGICRRVTYPRLEKVIKGYKKNGNGEKVEGLGGNLQYFRTDLVKETKSKIQVKIDGTKNLRIVLEKILQKIAQQNGIDFLGQNGKEEKISITNDRLI